MHRSRLAGFIIDCQGHAPDAAAAFWSAALGMASRGGEGDRYHLLDGAARDLHVEVQRVEHPSRVHLDLESDDIEAEVRRLEALGARRVEQRENWSVLEAPTGQRFCVVRARHDLAIAPGTTTWP